MKRKAVGGTHMGRVTMGAMWAYSGGILQEARFDVTLIYEAVPQVVELLSRQLPVSVGGYIIFHLVIICCALFTQLEHMYLKMHLHM